VSSPIFQQFSPSWRKLREWPDFSRFLPISPLVKFHTKVDGENGDDTPVFFVERYLNLVKERNLLSWIFTKTQKKSRTDRLRFLGIS
jgi:hypothetical protein